MAKKNETQKANDNDLQTNEVAQETEITQEPKEEIKRTPLGGKNKAEKEELALYEAFVELKFIEYSFLIAKSEQKMKKEQADKLKELTPFARKIKGPIPNKYATIHTDSGYIRICEGYPVPQSLYDKIPEALQKRYFSE